MTNQNTGRQRFCLSMFPCHHSRTPPSMKSACERGRYLALSLTSAFHETYCGLRQFPIRITVRRAVRCTWYRMSLFLPLVLAPLQWRHTQRDGVSNHRNHDCLLNRLFRRKSKKTSKLLVTGLCVDNPPVTGGYPSQRASNAENVSIWWRHHGDWWLYPPYSKSEWSGDIVF